MSLKNLTNLPKRLDKAVKKASVQALNRAATSTRAKYAKEASKELGIPSAVIRKRIKLIKARPNVLAAIMSIGTKILLAAQDFKGIKRIKIMSSRGIRYGASFKAGSKGSVVAPAGVILNGKNSGKKVIATNIGDHKYKTVRVDGLLENAKSGQKSLLVHMREVFKKNFESSIKFFMNK